MGGTIWVLHCSQWLGRVSKLLDTIPPNVLQEGMLHIQLGFKVPTVTPSFRSRSGCNRDSFAEN